MENRKSRSAVDGGLGSAAEGTGIILLDTGGINHIHTARCMHATGSDRELVEACIESGFRSMTVADHAPFPGDPFGNRMRYVELTKYISSFDVLRQEYRGSIDIHIGLETEYFLQYEEYYRSLCHIPEMDAGLFLGQHMYFEDGVYSFSLPKETLNREEYAGLGRAVIQGIRSGYFRRVAHPDRIFRRLDHWTPECEQLSEEIIREAAEAGMPLELNAASLRQGNLRPEFWKLVRKMNCSAVCTGADAHSVEEIRSYRAEQEKLRQFAGRP